MSHCRTVHRVSSLPRGELLQHIARAEVMLCPSYLEGFGLAAAEAMALGTAVIGSDTDGLRSLLDGNGMLATPGDVAAWSAATIKMLQNDGLRCQCAERARAAIQKRFNRLSAEEALFESMERMLDFVIT